MDQYVRQMSQDIDPTPLADPEFLRDRQVKVPRGQSIDPAGSAAVGVQAQDQAPKLRIDSGRVAEHVDASAPVRRVGILADAARDCRALVRGAAPTIGRK